MENNYKDTFLKDTLVTGVIAGLLIFAVSLLSGFLQWELNDHKLWSSLGVLLVLILCAAYFGNKRAEKAGKMGFTYGQGVGFLVLSFVFAGVICGVGAILIQKLIMPEYYAQVVDLAMEQGRERLETNPAMRGATPEMIDQSLNMSMKMLTSPIFVFFASLINTVLFGTLVSLFMSIFVKRPEAVDYEG